MGPQNPPADQSNNDGLVPATDAATPHNVDATRTTTPMDIVAADLSQEEATAAPVAKKFIIDLFQTAETHAEQFVIEAADLAEAKMKATEIVATKSLEGVVHRLEVKEDVPETASEPTDPNASLVTPEAGPTEDTTTTGDASLADSNATDVAESPEPTDAANTTSPS